MNSKKQQAVRITIQTLIVLVMLFSAAASAAPAYAANPPANDDFEDATKIASSSFSGGITDMTGATMEGLEPPLTCDGGNPGEASVWYTFQPTNSGLLTINTKGSGYDTVVTVFKAAYDLGAIFPPDPAPVDPFSLIELGCDDDVSGSDKTSSLNMAVRGGVRYYVEVTRKTGAVVTPPDSLKFSFTFTQRVYVKDNFYDASDMPIYFAPIGWQVFPVLPGVTYLGNVNVANNPGDSATAYIEGDSVQLCYATGPDMGNLGVYIDDVLLATIGQGSGTYNYQCWDSWTVGFPPFPGSDSLYYDNTHKLVLKHMGPANKKVNIDTIQVFPILDFDPPASITDLTATVTTSKVTLNWSATGDDSLFGSTWSYGRVTRNEVRYRLTPFAAFPADWDTATTYTVTTTTPLPSGSKQSLTINGLTAGVTYYFMIVGVDEAGNYGDPSMSSFVSVTPTTSNSYGTGLYDDRHAGWKYVGTWKALSNPDSLSNTVHQANALNSSATFNFTGNQFRLYYNAAPNYGDLDVYLDGAYLTTIVQTKSILPVIRRVFVSPILTTGPHSVKFVQTSLPYVTIDAIGIHTVTDGGAPDPINDLAGVSGVTDGSVDLTWTATGDDPGGVGTATSYEIRYSPSPILTQDDWEVAQPVTAVIPMPLAAGMPEGVTVTGLAPGVTYWFAIRANDDAGYSVFSNTTSATAAVVTLVYSGPGMYEDSDLNWLYSGIWTTEFPFLASGGDQHRCNLPGSAAAFLFTGDGFTLYYQTSSGFSGLTVYVDGFKITTINQKTTATYYQRTSTLSGFGAGNHTVQFSCTGKATIDAIEILP